MTVLTNRVRCRITGEQALRFVNLCQKNGIALRYLAKAENSIQIEIDANHFKKLRPLVRKTHVKIHILDRQGPAFFFYRHKRRRWFLIGVIACVVAIKVLSLFIWQIDIDGNHKYTDAMILQALAQMHVVTGCKKSAIDPLEIEEELRLMYNEITWVSANITGTKLQIRLQEGELTNTNDMVMNSDESGLPFNIVSDENAIITSLVTRRGTAAVNDGDEVKKGDVLIEGKVYIYNEDETLKKVDYLAAEGDISGRYQQKYEKAYQRKHEVKRYEAQSWKTIGIEIAGRKIALPDWRVLFRKRSGATLTEVWSWQKKLRLTPTFYLPVSLDYTEFVPYEIVTEDYTDDELKIMAENDLQNYLIELEKKGVQIISNSVTISLDTVGACAEGGLLLDGPIGREVPIRSDQMACMRQNE